MDVAYTATAAKALDRLPRNVRQTIEAKVERLAADPARNTQVKTLKGAHGVLRLRVGDWRVLFEIIERRTVRVLDVQPRGSAYR